MSHEKYAEQEYEEEMAPLEAAKDSLIDAVKAFVHGFEFVDDDGESWEVEANSQYARDQMVEKLRTLETLENSQAKRG